MTRTRMGWLAAIVLVLVAAVVLTWYHFADRESTDDAQVSGHVSPVAAKVGGTVTSVLVKDNQHVNVNDVLVEIDPHDAQIALDKAHADLAAAQAAAKAARTNVPIMSTTATSQLDSANAGSTNAASALEAAARDVDAAKAKLSAAEAKVTQAAAEATRATQDEARLKPLAAKDEIPKQQYDAAVATAEAAQAAVASAQASVAEEQANVAAVQAHQSQAADRLREAQSQEKAASTAPQQITLSEARARAADAQVLQAQAAVDEAQLNLDRTKVRAPANGVVSKKTVEVGQIVQPGQPLMAVTTLDDVWVTANFKETQLENVRPGQRAEISVDAYGGHRYTGHVDSIAGATGATFSLMPADNASGNFVKVVQRIPVKIVIDNSQNVGTILRPGMSVTAVVYMK